MPPTSARRHWRGPAPRPGRRGGTPRRGIAQLRIASEASTSRRGLRSRGLDPGGQRTGGELVLGHHPGAAASLDRPGVAFLVPGGGLGKGDEDRGAPDHRELGDGRRARPRYHQRRVRHADRQVLEERPRLRGNRDTAIGGADALDVLGPRLLDDAEPRPQRAPERRDGLGYHVGQYPRALAAADHQYRDALAVRPRLRVGSAGERGDGVAYRVAGPDQLRDVLGAHPLDLGESGGDGGHPGCQRGVGPAENGVLLVDHAGRAGPDRGEHGRQGGIAAEPDGGRRMEPRDQPARLQPAIAERGHAARGASDAAAQMARRDAVDPGPGPVAETGAAAIGDHRHGIAAAVELAGERRGREHVPAGAARGEDDGAGAHDRSSPMRRLVSASSSPMASATAISDDPP